MSGKLILLSNTNLLPVGGKGERRLQRRCFRSIHGNPGGQAPFHMEVHWLWTGDSSEQIHPHLDFIEITHLLKKKKKLREMGIVFIILPHCCFPRSSNLDTGKVHSFKWQEHEFVKVNVEQAIFPLPQYYALKGFSIPPPSSFFFLSFWVCNIAEMSYGLKGV